MDTTILGKNIKAYKQGNKYVFDDISYKDKMGRNVVWSIYVVDNNIYRNLRIDDGKVRHYDSIECSGKNSGKKNETSSHEQAILDAFSMWKKKCDTVVDAIFPMLAHDYRKHFKKLSLPFAVSRKIDGIRAIAQTCEDNVCMTSRLSKPFKYIERVKEDIHNIYKKFPDIIFDGEVYSHEIPFSRISGAVRKTKSKSVDDDMLEYWIFDIICDECYKDRMDLLKKIEAYYNQIDTNGKLRFVYYDVVNTRDDIIRLHEQYVKEGFEGVICRNLDGKYKQKFRSYDLQKYKDFEDDEFKIVNTKEGRGSEKGAIIFECVSGDKCFDVRPRGSIDTRKDMWNRRNEYIGKMLTVRYQTTQDHELPRFPVGICVRDYE